MTQQTDIAVTLVFTIEEANALIEGNDEDIGLGILDELRTKLKDKLMKIDLPIEDDDYICKIYKSGNSYYALGDGKEKFLIHAPSFQSLGLRVRDHLANRSKADKGKLSDLHYVRSGSL